VKSIVPDENGFCDGLCIENVKHQLYLLHCGRSRGLAFLVLSGSFNPIHVQHICALDLARQHAQDLEWAVVGGFLAPSSDTYVKAKLGSRALPLERRKRLCQLATEGAGWISVCSKAEFSSNRVCRRIRKELEHHCADILKGRRLAGVEIMGSDTVVRIFDRVLAQEGSSRSSQRGRAVFCFLRPGSEHAAEREHVMRVLLPQAPRLGVELRLFQPALGDQPLGWVSSSAIRDLVSKGDWVALRSKGWLHPAVLQALQTWAR
jgi:hypothetical protein